MASNQYRSFAYLGPAGTFTEQALRTLPQAAEADLIAMSTVTQALDEVRQQNTDAAIVPLENSIEGGVGATLDELANGSPLVITSEVLLSVNFGLFGRPGTNLNAVKIVGTHPHAEAQCRLWLQQNLPTAVVFRAASTADAAVAVAKGEYDAAICADIAAEENNLIPIATKIADNPHAITRFVVLELPATAPPRSGHDITSLVIFPAYERVGALMGVLEQFAIRGVNLIRIESRPTKERLGRYCFFLDCEGHVEDLRLGEALMGLKRIGAVVRYLGSYPRSGVPDIKTEPGMTDDDFRQAAHWVDSLRKNGK